MGLRREIGRYHAVVFTRVRNPGAPDRRLHVLYLLHLEEPPTPLIALVDYVIDAGHARALAWQRHMTRAVGLFVDFLAANSALLEKRRDPRVFALFAEALVAGTLDLEGHDPSGLFWEPKSVSRARRLLSAVTAFSDWLANRYGTRSLNPFREATAAEQIAYWRRLDRRKPHTLLGYTTDRSDHHARARMVRAVDVRRKSTTAIGHETKAFPSDRIRDLLFTGFAVPGRRRFSPVHERLSLKDILITILLHGGGLRESEPFHLFVSDVGVDPQNPTSAVVRLYHPEQGAAPPDYLDPLSGRYIGGDREDYLRVRWGLVPRTLLEGRYRAGWKDLYLYDAREKYALVHWFAPIWGELFLTLFKPYILHSRSRRCQHPFLFVSQKAGVRGDPYTVDSYRQAHARAVRRIGLIPAKALGTTPHGHRHAYGRRLADAEVEVEEITIQHVMHHKSPASQAVYTAPSTAAIASILAAAQSRLAGFETDPTDSLTHDIRLRGLPGAVSP